MTHTRNGRDARTRRKAAADERAARDKPSAREQVANLDARLGHGEGAAKERARLAVA